MLKTTTPIKTGRGEYMAQLPDGRVLCWGWKFREARDPFKKAVGVTGVTVFAYVSDLGKRTDLVPERIVGKVRLVAEASRVGRDALRLHVMPTVRDFAAKCDHPSATSH